MKKTFFALVMGIIMIGLASCGGGNKHSKAFDESKKVLDGVTESLKQATTCDDLDMAAFGILGLLAVEGIDEMPEAEQEELAKISDEIDKLIEQKKAELNCQDEELDLFDEEVPLDEPLEEELEEEVVE